MCNSYTTASEADPRFDFEKYFVKKVQKSDKNLLLFLKSFCIIDASGFLRHGLMRKIQTNPTMEGNDSHESFYHR